MKNYSEARDFFSELNKYKLDWTDEIEKIYKSISKIEIYDEINNDFKIKDFQLSISNESNNISTNLQFPPKINGRRL